MKTSLEIGPPPVTFTLVMPSYSVNLKRTVAALGVFVWLCGPAIAQENDRIQGLLDVLRTATPEQAATVERDLEREWSRSGSAAMDLLLKRGRAALAAGDTDVAIEHFTALTDHAPNFAEGYHARATAYFRASLYGPAVADLEKALTLNPNNYNAIFGLGVIFEEIDDNRRAAQLFLRVLALHPHHRNAETALEQLKSVGIGRTL
ncbi:MAG: tetratricopeptide repeat protein [Sulfitobacter sp.]